MRPLALALCLGMLLPFGFSGFWHHNQTTIDARSTRWVPYGGAWELDGTTILSKSDERDAKLMAVSTNMRDMVVDVDLALFGTEGDAGVIFRGADADTGINAYSGFYAGVRSNDDSLLLGRGDFAWQEYRNRAILGGVQMGFFYHLTIVAVGCRIAVRTSLPDGSSLHEGVEAPQCPSSGEIGLQAYHTPAVWRNLRIRPANEDDVRNLMQGEMLGTRAEHTLQEYTRQNPVERLKRKAESHSLEGSPTLVSELFLNPHNPMRPVSVRGTITLLSPMTYLEDASGGIVVQQNSPTLAVGDDVEATGLAVPQGGHTILANASLRVLASSTPPEPRMMTVGQAASGAADGRFVALDGILQRKWTHGGETILEMESNGVIYRAISEPRHFGEDLSGLRVGSGLMLSGVLRSDLDLSGDGAFALLLSPNQDAIRVVHPAPWWSTTHIIELGVASVFVAAIVVLLYGRIKLFYLMHIVHERELLADDLHDTIAQSFAGIGFQLRAVESKLSTSSAIHPQLARAQAMLRESHEELRQSITSLRVQIGTSTQLVSALELNALRLVRGGPLNVQCTCEGLDRKLPPRIADCFFRVGQEAISNAIQHSNASELTVNLLIQSRHVVLTVIDNGAGFAYDDTHSGSGLCGMRRRAEAIGARYCVVTGRHGTTVSLDCALTPHLHSVGKILKTNLVALRKR